MSWISSKAGLLALTLLLCLSVADDVRSQSGVEVQRTPERGIHPRLLQDGEGNVHLLYFRKRSNNPRAREGDLFYRQYDAAAFDWGPARKVSSQSFNHADPIYRARGWMKFLAVLAFIGGGLYAITIVGIIFAWIPIMFGVFLWQSATAIEAGYTQVSVEQVHRAHDKLRLLVIAYGILAIVGIVLFVVFFGAIISGLGDLDLNDLS